MSGFPTWGSDVGGYSSERPDRRGLRALGAARRDLAGDGGRRRAARTRRRGCSARPRCARCATRPSSTTSSSRYFYGLLRRGEPVLRPLGYAYPGRPAGVGAPSSSCSSGPTCSPRRSPAPARRRASTCRRAAGSTSSPARRCPAAASFTRETPLTEFPLYARAGAVVPFNLRTQTGSWWGAERADAPGPRRLPRDERRRRSR